MLIQDALPVAQSVSFNPFHLYLGAQIGYAGYYGQLKRYNLVTTMCDRTDMGKQIFSRGPHMGIGYTFSPQKWYVGCEWNLHCQKVKVQKLVERENGIDSVMSYAFRGGTVHNVGVLLGKFLTDRLMMYAEVGMSLTKFKLSSQEDDLYAHSSAHSRSFMWGIGVRSYFFKWATLSIAYQRTGKIKSISHYIYDNDDGEPLDKIMFRPRHFSNFMVMVSIPLHAFFSK